MYYSVIVIGHQSLVPPELRNIGLKVSFINSDDKVETWEFLGGIFTSSNCWKSNEGKLASIRDEAIEHIKDVEKDAISNFSDQRVTPEMLSEATKQLIEASGGGTITNLPDDEDIESIGEEIKVLKLKGRRYNPVAFSGLGYRILRKNITDNKNILTQQEVDEWKNSIIDIRYDFDLDGKKLAVPSGCVLNFQGGSMKNGELTGNDTKIINNGSSIIFHDALLSGWYDCSGHSYWFKFTDKYGDRLWSTITRFSRMYCYEKFIELSESFIFPTISNKSVELISRCLTTVKNNNTTSNTYIVSNISNPNILDYHIENFIFKKDFQGDYSRDNRHSVLGFNNYDIDHRANLTLKNCMVEAPGRNVSFSYSLNVLLDNCHFRGKDFCIESFNLYNTLFKAVNCVFDGSKCIWVGPVSMFSPENAMPLNSDFINCTFIGSQEVGYVETYKSNNRFFNCIFENHYGTNYSPVPNDSSSIVESSEYYNCSFIISNMASLSFNTRKLAMKNCAWDIQHANSNVGFFFGTDDGTTLILPIDNLTIQNCSFNVKNKLTLNFRAVSDCLMLIGNIFSGNIVVSDKTTATSKVIRNVTAT